MGRLALFLILLGSLVVINVINLQKEAFKDVVAKQESVLADFLNNAYRGSKQRSNQRKETKIDPEETTITEEKEPVQQQHKVAGLSCQAYGGPSDEIAAEMVYWSDIPSDAAFVSPYKHAGPAKKYLTFEPDQGGFNNIRMNFESSVTMAHAMGRTLVMPPSQGMYLLMKKDKNQKDHFSFTDFYHFDSVAVEHAGVEVISFEDYLKREIMTGNLVSPKTKRTHFPPNNRTDWTGVSKFESSKLLDPWYRVMGDNPIWQFDNCMATFPAVPDDPEGPARLLQMLDEVKQDAFPKRGGKYLWHMHPTPVNATPLERLRERLAHRKSLCIYNSTYQEAPVFHLMGDNDSGARLLVHFYAFLFFEDWRQEQWTKRFVRDHLRYVDEIQCAAARVVHAVRQKAKENGDPTGTYDTFHIRRGDFQYKDTRISAEQIYDNVKDVLVENSTIFIATDERDKSFFEVFRKHYKVYFLDDFMDELTDVNTNFYGMLDQLIASRGRTFVGVFYSTFTGYINRIRGYHSQKDKAEGYEKGIINSYFYMPLGQKLALRQYAPISPPMWAREFPLAWRDIDRGVGEL